MKLLATFLLGAAVAQTEYNYYDNNYQYNNDNYAYNDYDLDGYTPTGFGNETDVAENGAPEVKKNKNKNKPKGQAAQAQGQAKDAGAYAGIEHCFEKYGYGFAKLDVYCIRYG